jgi:NTE family protein
MAEAATKLDRAAQMLGEEGLRLSGPVPRPITPPTVIAPESLMPLEWIIDYEDTNHQTLFAMGKDDAERALGQRRSVA